MWVIGVKENDPAGSRGCWDFLKRPPDRLGPADFVQILMYSCTSIIGLLVNLRFEYSTLAKSAVCIQLYSCTNLHLLRSRERCVCVMWGNNQFLFQKKSMYEFMTSSVWKYLEVGRENDNVKTGTCRLYEVKLRCNGNLINMMINSFYLSIFSFDSMWNASFFKTKTDQLLFDRW